jgi:hypothetical protein
VGKGITREIEQEKKRGGSAVIRKKMRDRNLDSYREGPQAWCSSNKGARVELLLQVGESHLYFLVNSMIYLCYQCEMRITECMCIQGENLLCELPNDEIIIDKRNMRSAI